MIIKTIHIYGFGKYSNCSISLEPGVNIIYGRNEAGKSTLLAFIRSIFFGFESKRNAEQRYEPLQGGPFGGALILQDESGNEYRIERIGKRKSQGIVRVYLPNGKEQGEEAISHILAGIHPRFYQSVYSFGLGELSMMESLSEEQVGSYLYHAGTGVALPEIERMWTEEAEKLFKPRGNVPRINQLLQQLEDVDQQIAALHKENESYNLLHQEKMELDQKLEEMEAYMLQIKQELRKWEKAKELYPSWMEWKRKERILDAFPQIYFPEQGLSRLEHLEEQIRLKEVEREEWKQKLSEWTRQMNQLPVAQPILELEEEIVDLAAQRAKWEEKKAQMQAWMAEADMLRKEAERCAVQLGFGENPAPIKELTISFQMKEKCRQQREIFQSLSTQWETTREIYERKREEADDLIQALTKLKEEAGSPQLYEELKEQEEGIIHLQQLLQECESEEKKVIWMKQQYEDMGQRARQIRHQWEKQKKAQTKLLLPLLVLMAAMGLWGGFAFNQVHSALAWFTTAVVMAFILLATWMLFRSKKDIPNPDQSWREDIEQLSREWRMVEGSLQQKKDQLSSLSRNLNIPLQHELLALRLFEIREQRKKFDQIRERMKWLEESIAQHERELEKLQARLNSLKQKQQEELGNWNLTLMEWGIRQGMTPDGALDLLEMVQQAKESMLHGEALQVKCLSIQAEIEAFQHRVHEVWKKAKLGPSAEDEGYRMASLQKKLDEAKQLNVRRAALEEKIEEAKQKRNHAILLLNRLEEEVRGLLDAVDVHDSEQFRRRFSQYQEQQKLMEQVETLKQIYYSSKGEHEIEDILNRFSEQQIEEQISKYLTQIDLLQHRIQEALDRRGQLKSRLHDLESGDRLFFLHQQRSEWKEELQQEATKWMEYRMASLLLKKIKESFETEKQPRVLREASHLFQQITEGRYVRILSPFGEERLLAERKDGLRLEPGFLSRGTREQLFLCLRFALIRDSSQGQPLPILLDDILVNFDLPRMCATMTAIESIGQSHQILFLTCHSHIADLMKRKIPSSSLLDLSNEANIHSVL